MTQAEIAALVAKAVNDATKGKKPRKARVATDSRSKEERQAEFAARVVEVFAAEGHQVTPNVDVFTYNRWKEKGYLVKKGEKSIRVPVGRKRTGGIPLFHAGQVEKVDQVAA